MGDGLLDGPGGLYRGGDGRAFYFLYSLVFLSSDFVILLLSFSKGRSWRWRDESNLKHLIIRDRHSTLSILFKN